MKLWAVQILRLVAALLVVHLHAAERLVHFRGDSGIFGHAATLFGRCGVDLFFVISGLIITKTARDLAASDFIRRRARRILPMYYLAALPWVLMGVAKGTFGWRQLIATGLLWPATDIMTPPVLPVGWTLCFEALFYASFALVIWRRWTVAFVFMAFLSALLFGQGAVASFIGNPIIFEFLFGVALAYARPAPWAFWWIPVGVAILILGAALDWPPFGLEKDFLSGRDGWFRVASLGIPAALITWGALQIDARRGALTDLGDASYSIYLFHAPLVAAAVWAMARFSFIPSDLIIVFACGFALLIGWRVHELFEKPLLVFFKRPSCAAAASHAAARMSP